MDFKIIRVGLLITLLSLIFGIGFGALFGANEQSVKSYISNGIKQNPTVHDKKSQAKIWRYAQRSHFHATGERLLSYYLKV